MDVGEPLTKDEIARKHPAIFPVATLVSCWPFRARYWYPCHSARLRITDPAPDIKTHLVHDFPGYAISLAQCIVPQFGLLEDISSNSYKIRLGVSAVWLNGAPVSPDELNPHSVMLEHGLYFISGVTLQQGIALRMGGGDTVLMDSIAQLYGVADEEDLNIRFNVRAWHGNAHERNNSRIQNRRKVPVDVRDIVADEELQAQDRTLAEQGVATMPLPREAGPDIAPPCVHQMNEGRDPEESINDRVARIWRQ
ncbi:hypothetical protein EDB85DRAFT_2156740 [Lactarius pseudohatsudake]|nr:hypothetical protein EDB85DRAFT_2156740 [Lactarius pseudohatsudake]